LIGPAYELCGLEGSVVNDDIKELFRNRVSEEQVAQVLQLIATMPNRREQPIPGDLPGNFDFWFDGGAGQIITGWNEYTLADGTRVMVGTTFVLSVTIEFSNGSRIRIQQESGDVRIPWTGTTRAHRGQEEK
jgi:hypothetical protein